MALRIIRRLRDLIDVDAANIGDGKVPVYRTASGKHEYETGVGGSGAPTDVDYLVGTASGSLSAEIAVGATPGGELGGTWASPTVDSTHAGSSHAGVQSAAEATAQAALDLHTGDTSGAHAASAISILDTANDFTATDVEAALAELQSDAEGDAQALSDHVTDSVGAHAATAIAFTPDGSIAATTVQAAIVEVRDEASGIAASVLDANTVLYAVTDDTPAALAMGASTILARLAAGNIVAATPAELRTLLALVVGTNVQAYDADLTTWASLTPSAFFQTLVDDTTAAATRATLGLPDIPWTTVTKLADESVASSTTVQADDELVFTAVSGGLYEIEMTLVFGSPAGAGTPDLKIAAGEDGTNRGGYICLGLSAADAIANQLNYFFNSSTIALGTAATDRLAFIRSGHYRGNGGTFALYWAQNTSGSDPTIVRAGSILRYRRIV